MAILDGIIGCWSPSLGATGYRLLDRTPYGNHGTLTNMDAGTDWVAKPPQGLCLDFDGTNDNVNYGTQINLGGATYASFSAWVRPSGLSDLWAISRYSSGLGSGTMRIDYFGVSTVTTAGQVTVFVGGTTSNDYLNFYSSELVTSSAWNHIAGSVFVNGNASTCVMAINGKPCTVNASHLGTRPTAFSANNIVPWRSMAITGFSGTIAYNAGRLGELTIWRAPKTVAELCELNRLGDGWIGRELTGMNRRRRLGRAPAFRAAWALRQRLILGGGGGLG